MIYLILFFEFFKIGLFSIGGGLATLPFLYDLADKYGWFSGEDLANMLAVSESTPGPIGINMSTYVGFTVGGIPGALIATIALVIPSIIIIVIIAKFLAKFNDNKWVKASFYTLRPAVTALIAVAGIEVFKIALLNIESFNASGLIYSLFNIKAIILFLVVLTVMLITHKKSPHPIFFIVAGAIAGIVFKM